MAIVNVSPGVTTPEPVICTRARPSGVWIAVVLAVGCIGDELVSKIKERTVGLRTGDGTRGCDMGPLVTGQAQERVSGYIDAGEAAGAELDVDPAAELAIAALTAVRA